MKSSFEKAHAKTLGHEVGYANDPDDRGGETWNGIARKKHPDWEGWDIVDDKKIESRFPLNLYNNKALKDAEKAFYLNKFWLPMGCEHMPRTIADEVFDTGVNCGQSTAVKILQRSLSKLNKNERYYKDLKEDGQFGKISHAALRKILNRGEIEVLYKIMNIYQGEHYLSIMDDSPRQEKYTRGWLKRVEFIKHTVI